MVNDSATQRTSLVYVGIRYLDTTLNQPAAIDVATLSLEELARAAQFSQAQDRLAYVAAHSLLRHTLSQFGDIEPSKWRFEAAPGGKPVVAGASSLKFSLSHTRGLVCCSVTMGDNVGIDVEQVARRPDAMAIARHLFSPVEIDRLVKCSARERYVRFIELWTLKEACGKCLGTGIRYSMDEFEFKCDDQRLQMKTSCRAEESAHWECALWQLPRQYRLALVVRTQARKCRIALGGCAAFLATTATVSSGVMLLDSIQLDRSFLTGPA